MQFSNVIVIGYGGLTIKITNYLNKIFPNIQINLIITKQISPILKIQLNSINAKINFIYTNRQITSLLKSIISTNRSLIISAINTFIFPSEIVNNKNSVIINYHNSLLPNYPGMNVEAWQLFNQEKISGITWHFVNNQIDAGQIIMQKQIDIPKNCTSIRLLKLQSDLAFIGFKEIINQIFLNKTFTLASPSSNATKRKLYKINQKPNNGYLNIQWTSDKIIAFLHSMDYGVLKTLGDPKIKINNYEYTWEDYCISNKPLNFSKNTNKDKTLIIQSNDKFIYLKNIKFIDQT